MGKPVWCTVRVTRRQARMMADALRTMELRLAQAEEIGHLADMTTKRDRVALFELRRRLIVADLLA